MQHQRTYPRPDESALAFVIERAHIVRLGGTFPHLAERREPCRPLDHVQQTGTRISELASLTWKDVADES